MADLDDLDLKILDLVQRNNQLTTETIARRVALSSSAVQRRLKKLRKNKIIDFEVSAISPEAVGRALCSVVSIKLDREAPRLLKEFKEVVLAMPEVMQCYYVTGQTDFVLVVTSVDMADYNSFVHRLSDRFPHIASLSTGVVLERIKKGVSIPLMHRANSKNAGTD